MRLLAPRALRALVGAAPKGGTLEYRNRPGQHGASANLKEHEYGVGCYGTSPSRHKTITQHVNSWRWFYDEFAETRGKGEGQNPAHAAVVSHVLHLVGRILGRARVKLTQPLEPWMLKRMLFCLRADEVYGSTVALVLSHGLCLGERSGAWFIRDHGHCGYTAKGEIVHRIYLKTDRMQARSRRELHAQRGARFARGAC